MIQRIQSVYLLAVAILMGITAFSNLAKLITGNVTYTFNTCGIYSDNILTISTLPLCIVALIVALIAAITIFLYKQRGNQIKMSLFNSALIIAFYIAFCVYYLIAKGQLNVTLNIKLPLALPLIAFILNLLSLRSIRKDEALIKSLNRIR